MPRKLTVPANANVPAAKPLFAPVEQVNVLGVKRMPAGTDISGLHFSPGEEITEEALSGLSPRERKWLEKNQPTQEQAWDVFSTLPETAEFLPNYREGSTPRVDAKGEVQKGAKWGNEHLPFELGERDLPERIRGVEPDPVVFENTDLLPANERAYLPHNEKKFARAVQNIQAEFARSPSVESMAELAKAGKSKKDWYSKLLGPLTTLFGPETPRFVALLAATSPRGGVKQNFAKTVKLWNEWTKLKTKQQDELYRSWINSRQGHESKAASVWYQWLNKVTGLSQEEKEGGLGDINTMETHYPGIGRALFSREPELPGWGILTLDKSGWKTDSFRSNILGNLNNYTSDTWDAKARVQDPNRLGKVTVYLANAIHGRMVARELNRQQKGANWTPAGVQAAIWSVFRTMANFQGASRMPKHRREGGRFEHMGVQGPLDTLTNLLGGDVAKTEDFVTMLTDPHTQDKYERYVQHVLRDKLGLGKALDALRSEAGGKGASTRGANSPAIDPGSRHLLEPFAREAARSMSNARKLQKKGLRVKRAANPSILKFPVQQRQLPYELREHLEELAQSYPQDPKLQALAQDGLLGDLKAISRLDKHLQRKYQGQDLANLQSTRNLQTWLGHYPHMIRTQEAEGSYSPQAQRDTRVQHPNEQGLHTPFQEAAAKLIQDQQVKNKPQLSLFKASRKGSPLRYNAIPPVAGDQQQGHVFASDNTDEQLDFNQAMERTRSANHKSFVKSVDQIRQKLGLVGKSYSGVGDWVDGAEQSVMQVIDKPQDPHTLRYAAAWYGLNANQKSVLVFHPEQGGKDSTYTVSVPHTNLEQIRNSLNQAGIPFRTVIPSGSGVKVVIFDQGRGWRSRVAQFASQHNARIAETLGNGEYLGGSTRSAARAKYREVIRAYESGQHGTPSHGGQV